MRSLGCQVRKTGKIVAPGQTAAARSRSRNCRNGESVSFPDLSQILDVKLSSDDAFRWAERFRGALQQQGVSVTEPCFKKFVMISEFSGSGCAEAALKSVLASLGAGVNALEISYVADIQPHCRQMLSSVSHGLRAPVPQFSYRSFEQVLSLFDWPWLVGKGAGCIFGDILELLPKTVREAAYCRLPETDSGLRLFCAQVSAM